MHRDVRGTRDLIAIYDHLIMIAKMNMNKEIKTEWGKWMPNQLLLKTLTSRRNKLQMGE